MFRRHDRAGRGDNTGGDTAPTTRVELPRRVVDVPVGPSVHQGHGGAASGTGRIAVGGDAGPVLVREDDDVTVTRRETARDDEDRRLVVGTGVELKGDVKGCRRVQVDGDLEATIASTEQLLVGPEGAFRGTGEVENAEIAGTVDGTLTVRGRLLVRSTGRVKGDVRFGELEIERGGQISGNVDAHAKGPQLATVQAAAGGDD
jgi:cytoskeletal protein CcmA (bactofilin family)